MKKYVVENLDHQGRGIIRDNGLVIFVSNALPQEEVEIEIIKTKKNLKEACVTSYQKISNDRQQPLCPYYDTCGGCHIMHMPYTKQLEWKEQKVREIFNKFMDYNVSDCIQNIMGSQEWNYRNKATFQVKQKIGYFKKHSNIIVPIEHCDIVDLKINHLFSIIAELDVSDCSQIVIRASKNTNQTMVVLDTKDFVGKNIIDRLKPYTTSIYQKGKEWNLIYGKPYIEETIGDFIFKISPDSFFQVNTKQAETLYQLVLKYASLTRDDCVLDLYCGTGTIGLYLSKFCKKVLGIEINQQAVCAANENKGLNEIENVDFICSDVASMINKIKESYDVIIVDPPRSGLDKNTISYLKGCNAKRIVYVSCNPVTLARDLNCLQDCYEVKELTPVDMFPQTYHVECVCVLNRKSL